MVSAESQQQLSGLIQNHGRVILSDAEDLERKVREAIADAKDSGLLLMAVRSGVPQALVAGSASGEVLAQKLQDDNFLAQEPARDAVQAWATALGVTVSFATPAILSLHTGPPLPHVEVIEPPSMQTPRPPPDLPAAPAPSSSAPKTAVILMIVFAVVIVAGGVGFVFWKRSQDVASAVPSSDKPVAVSTTGAATGSTSGQSGEAPMVPGGIGSMSPGPRTPAPIVGNSAGSTADSDMAAYNVKLARAHQLFDQATETFKQQNETIPATEDENTQMDQAAPMWDAFSQAAGHVASDLDAITPPPQAATIHRKLADFIRQFSTMVEDGAQAARAHDGAAFEANGTKVKDYGTASGQELNSLIVGAGFDIDQYAKDGTLVKKK